MLSKAKIEQRALFISMISIIFFILLALLFSFITKSDSILFDGIYSLISFAIAIITLWVAKLAEKPDDEVFHFGYTRFEPLLNVVKSLFILLSCVYALSGAVKVLISGGNEIDLGPALIYSAFAAAGGFIISLYLRRVAGKVDSGLLKLEATEWMIDSFLSTGILLGFLIAMVISRTSWSHLTPYVDPALLIIIAALALPAPVKALAGNFRELVDMAPPEPFVNELSVKLEDAIKDLPLDDYEFRLTKYGRNTFMLVHLIVSDDFSFTTVEDLDRIREDIENKILAFNGEINIEILFIKDRAWAELN